MDLSYLGALLAIIAFGTYMVPLRRYPEFSSYAVLFAVAWGALLLSLALAFGFDNWTLSPLGFLCGAVWVLGGALCFNAVQRERDLSATSVRAMGSGILVAFCSGVILGEKVYMPLAVMGIVGIFSGLFLISPQWGSVLKSWRSIAAGVVFGLHLLPFQLSGMKPLDFSLSYALGITVFSSILLLIVRRRERISFLQKTPWIVAFFAGILWMAGTHGCFWAIDSKGALGYATGYPLTQLNLLVNIAWGVLIFGEYKKAKERVRLGFAAMVILVGAFLLAAAK